MNKFQMRRSAKAIAGVLIVGSLALTACATPPPSTALPPQASAPTLRATSIATTPVPTPDAVHMDIATSSATSPDGQWVAETTVATPKSGDSYYTNLTVTDAAGTSRWAVFDAWAPYGLGYTCLLYTSPSPRD